MKIFIDCGGNVGQSINRFKKSKLYANNKDFKMHSFEPLSHLSKYYENDKLVEFHKEAIWIYDGETTFYIDKKNEKAQGSTLVKEKYSGKLDKEHPVNVPCIDFSKWIVNTFNANQDKIILKMDIEGAEYEVLKHMITTGAIYYINTLFVEFHWKKINLHEKDHNLLVNSLKRYNHLKLIEDTKDFNL